MKPDDAPSPIPGIRAVRWLYRASMMIGFPLWLITAFIVFAEVWFTIWPLPEIGPIEFKAPSAVEAGILRAAVILFFVNYPLVYLLAHRVERRPWIVFAGLLLPVLMFCYAAARFSIADSGLERDVWLACLGSLALIMTAGLVAAGIVQRSLPGISQS